MIHSVQVTMPAITTEHVWTVYQISTNITALCQQKTTLGKNLYLADLIPNSSVEDVSAETVPSLAAAVFASYHKALQIHRLHLETVGNFPNFGSLLYLCFSRMIML